MLDVKIDDTVETFIPAGENCFGQVFEKLSQRVSGAGKVIIEVKMNGQPLTGGRQADYYKYPIEEIESIELQTADPQVLAGDALNSTEEHLKMLLRNTLRASELFRLGDILEANESYAKLIEGIRWLLKGISALTGMMKLDPNAVSYEGQTLRHFQDELFIPIFDNMYNAQQSEDWIALADILEYELNPAFGQWENLIGSLRSAVVEVN